MAFDVSKWLKEDMGFSDDEIKDLAPKFTPKADVLDKGYLRQSDYSKNMDGLKKAQTDLAAANDRLTAEMAEWATVQAANEPITKKMRDDLEKAQLKVTQLTSRVERIATDAGLDPAKALEGIDQVVPPKKDDQPPVDLSGYVKTGDLGGLANMALTLPAELQSIADEHFDLTGKRLDTRTIVREIQARAGTRGNQKSLDPREIWMEQHNIQTLRDDRSKKQHDDEISAAEARGREAALSEMAVPGSTPPGRHAPVFHTTSGKPRESVLQRPQPGTTVNAAVGALRSGKYRTGSGSKTT